MQIQIIMRYRYTRSQQLNPYMTVSAPFLKMFYFAILLVKPNQYERMFSEYNES